MFIQTPQSDGLYIRPFRPDRRLIRLFIKYYAYLVGVAVSVIVLASLWPVFHGWTLLVVISYLLYVFFRIWAQNRKDYMKVYAKSRLHILRFLVLAAGVTIILRTVYQDPAYMRHMGNDTLWLLYIPAISVIGQRGSRRSYFASVIIVLLMVYWVTPVNGKVFIPFIKPITYEIFLRWSWLVFLSFTSYVLLRYMSDAIADLNLIISIQNKIRELEAILIRSKTHLDEHMYLEKTVEIIKNDLAYDHVNIFKLDQYKKKLLFIAAACKGGKVLQSQGFEMDVAEQKSIIGYVARNETPYMTNNVALDGEYMAHQAFTDTRAELAVPIHVRNRLFGVLDIQVQKSQYFLDQDQKAVEILANQIGWVIDNSDQYSHIGWINRIVETIADPIFTQTHLDDTLQEIADTAHDELGADLVLLYSYDPGVKDGLMGPIYSGDVYHPERLQNPLNAKGNAVWRLIEDTSEIYLNEDLTQTNLQEHPLFKPSDTHIEMGKTTFIEREKVQAHAIVRLLIKNQCVGVLFMNFRKPRVFTAWDKRRYFSFAHLAALAIHKMQLQQHLIQTEKNELSNMFHDMLIADAVGIHKILKSINLQRDEQEKLHEKIEHAIDGTQILNNDIRNILRLLRENAYEDLEVELEKLCLLLKRMFRVNITVSWAGGIRKVSDTVAREIYLVVREALTNAIRHGKAMDIDVTCTIRSQVLRIAVVDNGVGFDPKQVKRMNGLLSMQYRIKEMDGEFKLRSNPGKGTKILLAVPIQTASGGNSA